MANGGQTEKTPISLLFYTFLREEADYKAIHQRMQGGNLQQNPCAFFLCKGRGLKPKLETWITVKTIGVIYNSQVCFMHPR